MEEETDLVALVLLFFFILFYYLFLFIFLGYIAVLMHVMDSGGMFHWQSCIKAMQDSLKKELEREVKGRSRHHGRSSLPRDKDGHTQVIKKKRTCRQDTTRR